MTDIRIDLKELPADVGHVYADKMDKQPHRFYNDIEIEKVWSCIQEKVKGKKDVDLLVVGYMPLLLPSRLTYHCIKAGITSFSICRPGGLVECVYDERVKA
ncbi:hypothetical protein MSHOH_1479 [Methanosarcina horonobensis HB-1 = JCM 15518]|uniref:Uncharacterized protein n=1 Tax=Methanosarcina horonobensis HB-1 = JCM 15518 TaxID=1434110 RepID=A0A0E3SD47_9EURY|nr:hypothetical protein [Methanosarcina horonobensis]AKB77962.1 hypothetical protein MSHOH_1479 [Methanosarcina horonobensis HB-1 = JCM 15518]